MQRGILLQILALLALLLVAPGALAQTQQQRNEARKLGGEALDLVKAGDFKAALAKFQEADKLVPAPTLKVRIARCLDKLDRMKEAAEKYREVIAIELKPTSPKVYAEARDDAVNDLAKLLPQVPKLTVLVAGPGSETAEVSLDGKPFARSSIGEEQTMDPGFYQLEAKAGDKVVQKAVRLDRGKSEKVELRFAQPEAPPVTPTGLKTYRIAGLAIVGVSGAALVAGVVAGGLVLKDKGTLQTLCDPNTRTCVAGTDGADVAKRFNAERAASTGLLVAGGVVGAVGAGLLVYASLLDRPAEPAKDDKPAATIRPYLDVNGGGICGTF